MKREIEVLWKLEEPISNAVEKLIDASFIGEKKIVDRYFYDPLRPTLQPFSNGRLIASMRIRETGDGACITYKNDHFESDTWLYSDEYETSIGNTKKVIDIFSELGFKPLVTVAVLKKYYHAHPYEITFEEVTGLGSYIEVEYIPEDDSRDVLSIKRDIRAHIASLGIQIGDEENAGKPELLLRTQQE